MATSDSGSFKADGALASECRWCGNAIMFASTSIVCGVRSDKAVGPDVGVDDHSVKLPYIEESSVCSCVSSCCLVGYVVLLSLRGVSCSDLCVVCVSANGELSCSILSEHCSSYHTTTY